MKGNFKLILIVVFMVAAIFGILVFSGLIPLGSQKNSEGLLGTVTLWGTEKTVNLAQALENFNKANPTFLVKYIEKDPETFDSDLLEALASGTGPDMFLISNNLAYKYSNKIYTIPYQSYPLASFKNNFAGAGEVFLTSKGVLAFPITIDPLVMYYNRSILDTNNIIYPPQTWSDFDTLVPTLTKLDAGNKIKTSAVAMGQFANVLNAKSILATLFMQVGNPVIAEKNGIFSSTLDDNTKSDLSSVLKFYTNFSDPLNSFYTWNRSLQNSQDAFSSENLAFYFGYSSELPSLVQKNPNENFAVAPMPQVKNSNYKTTEAEVTGIAISSFSKNFNTAFLAASLMATTDFAKNYIKAASLVPARRDLLSQKQTDDFYPVFYSSALYARSWIDPLESDTNDIFRNMVEGVLSNNMTPSEAIKDSSAKLDLLLIKK